MNIVYIDAHGPDHGLKIEIDTDRHEVTVRQWSECCEPNDEGSYSPHIQTATVELSRLLDPKAEHLRGRVLDRSSMRRKVADAALCWLGYWGGDEEPCEDDERPCDYFGSYWGRHQAKDAKARPEHYRCDTCGAMPTEEP